ncbi:hypothetical protein NC653_006550 [Populus alba x Populus x berolinensis]|uniref:Phytocyanin domain-containing protein n=1 Tax=Populus alba x Populus x berolinensis TaxID=444605 RepID=A0AAD6REI8_9ROSI|nr:hypothetical protein NC653_006550 [Populus alba x Populus x berolinensis]
MDYVKRNIQIRKSNSLPVLSLYAPAFLQPIFVVFQEIMANLRKTILVVSFLTTALCGVSMAVVYQVGDSAGWTSMGQVDYQDWAANKIFHSGDTLVFNYNNQFHNMKQVTHQGFESCNCNITTSYLYQRLRYSHSWTAAWLLLLHMWLPWSLSNRIKD